MGQDPGAWPDLRPLFALPLRIPYPAQKDPFRFGIARDLSPGEGHIRLEDFDFLKDLTRRDFLRATVCGTAAALGFPALSQETESRPPNFVIIFTDDQGYGDLGCYGSETIRTPHIDRMADEGVRFTDFYVSSGVCTPSRASLLTGCYAQRNGMALFPPWRPQGGQTGVIFPPHDCGLHPNEKTIAILLKERGYATACIGK